MKNTKWTIIPASLHRHRRIERYLEKTAAEGWLLEGASALFFRFRRVEPQKLRYEVVSFPEGAEEKNLDLAYEQRRCEAAEKKGWKLAARQGGFLIFYTEQANPAPVVESATQKYEDTNRLLKHSCKEMAVASGLYLIHLLLLLLRVWDEPLEYFGDGFALLVTTVYMLFLIMTIGQWIELWCWQRKASRVLKKKWQFLEYHPSRPVRWGCIGGMLASALIVLAYTGIGFEFLVLTALLVCFVVLVPLIELLNLLLQPTRLTEKWRGAILSIVTIALMIGSQVPIFMAADELPEGGYERKIVGTCTDMFGNNFDIHDDEMPLVMADFYTGDTTQHSRTLHKAENSPFLSVLRASEWYHGEEDRAGLEYELYTVRLPSLYDDCLYEFRGVSKDPGDPNSWGAKEVYVGQFDYNYNTYLVLWEDKILFLKWRSVEPLTTEQIETIAEKLNPTE